MRSTIRSTALAVVMAMGVPLAIPSVGYAQITLELDEDGPRIRADRDRCDPDFEDCRPSRRERFERREERRAERRGCTEERALDKADRMGLQRVRIDRVGRRTIDVRGRTRDGERVFLTFGRQPGCPVLR